MQPRLHPHPHPAVPSTLALARWSIDHRTLPVDDDGWQYSTNWSGPWSPALGVPAPLVRVRRWYRHRALVDAMDERTAARLSDEAIEHMTGSELRKTVASAGLSLLDCADREALRTRAREARDLARQHHRRQSATEAVAEALTGPASGGGGAAGRASVSGSSAGRESVAGGRPSSEGAVALMPPVASGRSVQLQLHARRGHRRCTSRRSAPHGLLELTPEGIRGPLMALPTSGWYQLGISLHTCPGAFGRSKMLTVWPRIVLVNALPHHAIAYKQHDLPTSGEALFPSDERAFHFIGGGGSVHDLRDGAAQTSASSANRPRRKPKISVCLLRRSLDRADDTSEVLANCDWLISFPIDEAGELTIVAKAPDPEMRGHKLFLNVDVQVAGAETRVVFSLQEAALAPYRIDNHTQHSVVVSQSPCSALEHPRVIDEVRPAQRAPFAWEQFTDTPTIDVHVENVSQTICLDNLQLQGVITLPHAAGDSAQHAERLRYRMLTDGPTKVLLLLPLADGRGGGRVSTVAGRSSLFESDSGRISHHSSRSACRRSGSASSTARPLRSSTFRSAASASTASRAPRGRR